MFHSSSSHWDVCVCVCGIRGSNPPAVPDSPVNVTNSPHIGANDDGLDSSALRSRGGTGTVYLPTCAVRPSVRHRRTEALRWRRWQRRNGFPHETCKPPSDLSDQKFQEQAPSRPREEGSVIGQSADTASPSRTRHASLTLPSRQPRLSNTLFYLTQGPLKTSPGIATASGFPSSSQLKQPGQPRG
ncbi:hypothetical protein LY76DRAFT_346622 [Colletotrichum caudatum]|nr:hypothetical protein LY76DRAFT_346622 [Colletotrichum caudatum]